MANLLLVLGTGLIAVATVVFAAVNWDRLGASFQGFVLLAATVVATVGAVVARRRSMPATAEALALVAMLGGLADAHALRVGAQVDVHPDWYWALAVAVVSAGGWWLGRATGIVSSRVAAGVTGQVPVMLALSAIGASPATFGVVLLAQVAVVAALAARTPNGAHAARVAAFATAAWSWSAIVVGALVTWPWAEGSDRLQPALVLAVAAAVAGLVAGLWSRSEQVRTPALLAATLVGFFAAFLAVDVWVGGELTSPTMALIAVPVVAVGTTIERRWGQTPASIGTAVVGVTSLALVGAGLVVVDAATRTATEAWSREAGARAVDAGGTAVTTLPAAGPLAVQLLAVAGLILAGSHVMSRRRSIAAAAALAVVTVGLAPLLLPLSIGGAVAVAEIGMAVSVAATLAARRERWVLPIAATSAAACAAIAAVWAAADDGLSLVAAGSTLAGSLAVAAMARHLDRNGAVEVTAAAAGTSVVAAAVTAGVGAVMLGAGAGAAVATGGVVALAAGLVAAMSLDPLGRTRGADGGVGVVAEVAAWAVHVVVVAAVSHDRGALAVTLAAGVLAAGLHAARPGRRPMAGVALGEGLALSWLQLSVVGVTVVEAYTLPLALVLLAVGAAAERRGDLLGDQQGGGWGDALPSWVTLGPGLVVGLAPTVVLGLADPGSARSLIGLAVGAAVLVAGAATRRRAPVDVGTAVVVVLGLGQLAPVVGELPNWVTLGATGAALVAVGATFEQRRRDARALRDRYGSLR